MILPVVLYVGILIPRKRILGIERTDEAIYMIPAYMLFIRIVFLPAIFPFPSPGTFTTAITEVRPSEISSPDYNWRHVLLEENEDNQTCQIKTFF